MKFFLNDVCLRITTTRRASTIRHGRPKESLRMSTIKRISTGRINGRDSCDLNWKIPNWLILSDFFGRNIFFAFPFRDIFVRKIAIIMSSESENVFSAAKHNDENGELDLILFLSLARISTDSNLSWLEKPPHYRIFVQFKSKRAKNEKRCFSIIY